MTDAGETPTGPGETLAGETPTGIGATPAGVGETPWGICGGGVITIVIDGDVLPNADCVTDPTLISLILNGKY
jgi:hypothetical protein